jgi:hypothetical protein
MGVVVTVGWVSAMAALLSITTVVTANINLDRQCFG